jgi:hypothetical protein
MTIVGLMHLDLCGNGLFKQEFLAIYKTWEQNLISRLQMRIDMESNEASQLY